MITTVKLFNRTISVFLITVLFTTIAQSQEADTIYASDIRIGEIGYNNSLDSVSIKLGTPVDYSMYEEEEGEAEGYDKWFYFTYDSLKLAFYEWNKEVYLSSFVTKHRRYEVELGEAVVSVGDSMNVLQTNFPNSFDEFVSRGNPDGNKAEEFYIRIAIVYPNAVSYDGIINIKIFRDRITEISASFQPA